MKMWYDKPAAFWHEALPVGNGRLGGMVYGGPVHETVKLNEDSIWSGKHLDRVNPDARENLPKIRSLIREGNIQEAQRLAMYALSGTPNSERSYQPAGECYLNMHHTGEISCYRRELDLEKGVARTSYQTEGTNYYREILVSAPDQCMVIHLGTEDGQTAFSFDCLLGRNHNCTNEVSRRGGNTILFTADTGKEGISFCTALRLETEGGSVRVIGEHLIAEDVREAWLYLDVETSFRQEDPAAACLFRLEEAAAKGGKKLTEDHCEDFSALFNRLKLHFDRTEGTWETSSGEILPVEVLPTDERLRRVQAGQEDMGLMELYFQYGRYLLISSSRPGSLPANLQGIWNDQMYPVWDSKFTININTQMNYWPAGSGSLTECQLPLFDLLERLKESGRDTAERMYGCRGSVAHHNTDLYADSAPQDHCITSTFWVMGEAWLATHIWEQYLYTGDKEFLKEHFDVLEQCVLFFYDFLVEGKDGKLVTSPSMSPENTYRREDGTLGVLCESAVMDTEILTELFTDYIAACRTLGLEAEKAERAEAVMARFPDLKIGKWGQLMEWMEDYDEPEPGHRHISHLYGVYPGSSISWDRTPELMKAAKVSLERRLASGGGHTGWSRAWIIGLWAHFRDGKKAYENLQAILTMGTYPNLMDNHPLGERDYVFQIDGNLGACAAVLEMLAYSRPDRLELLPAVTEETSGGSVSGLGLRSGGTLSMEWRKGRVKRLSILPGRTTELTLCVNGAQEQVKLEEGVELVREYGEG